MDNTLKIKAILDAIEELEPICIVKLDMPDYVLSQNCKKGHWAKASAASKNRALAKSNYEDQLSSILTVEDFEPFTEATIRRVFYFKDNRKRDKDGFNAMCKSTTDALVPDNAVKKTSGCGLLKDDDKIIWLPTEFRKAKVPRLDYEFYELK